MFTELYSELLTDKTALISYEIWHEISYSHSKILKIIRTKTIIYKKESELKKAEKFLKWEKKMILMRYKNWSIYWLHDRESDSVVVSKSIDFNENLLTDENTENNEIINQNSIFFIKFFNKNNKFFLNLLNLMSESVRDKAEAKKNMMKISFSWEKMSIMRHEKSKKDSICK